MRRDTPKSQGPTIQGVYVSGDSSNLLRRHVALKPVKTTPVPLAIGFPWWLTDKEVICQCRRHRSDPWVGKIPWRRAWQPTSVFLSGEFHGQNSLAGYSPWVHKRVRRNLVSKKQWQLHTRVQGNRQAKFHNEEISSWEKFVFPKLSWPQARLESGSLDALSRTLKTHMNGVFLAMGFPLSLASGFKQCRMRPLLNRLPSTFLPTGQLELYFPLLMFLLFLPNLK